ncbi:MAG: sigma-70 family RNA polymerase sigma factor [Pseudomonadota bacterium]
MSDDQLTRLLQEWQRGDESALEQLTPAVYDELKRLATAAFRSERPGHTLQPTALVNEAYLKLINASVDWQDRAHFFALAARMMRRILVNHAKARIAQKRGGGMGHETYQDDVHASIDDDQFLVLTLDDQLHQLAELDPRSAEAIELHYFAGLTHKEMSLALNISTSTLERDLKFAKAWMRKNLAELKDGE